MRFWKRLTRYTDEGPSAAGGFELMPAKEFRALVCQVVDGVLLERGWSREKGLRWLRTTSRDWVNLVLEMQNMKGGVAVRWGLHLPAIPRIKSGVALDLSYDPHDYERSGWRWGVSALARRDEICDDVREVVGRSLDPAEQMADCCHDLASLLRCFEKKKSRKYLRFGIYSYPQEVLAYAVVLGLAGKRGEADEELRKALERAEVTASKKEALEKKVSAIWSRGSLQKVGSLPQDSAW